MNIEEQKRFGELLKYESDKNYYHEIVTIAKGQNFEKENILIERTGGGCTGIAAAATSLYGVLLQDVDATNEEKAAIVVACDVIVNEKCLVYPTEATAAQKKAIKKLLEDRGIVLMEEA